MNNVFRKSLVIGIIFLFLGASVLAGISGDIRKADSLVSESDISTSSVKENEQSPNAPAPLDEGLVGYWSFDEGSGTIAHDGSGNGNDGTIVGATWTTGVSGNALDFDGTGDYVNVPDDNSLSFGDSSNDYPFTFTAWIKRYSTGHNIIFSKYNSYASPMRQEYDFRLDSDNKLLITLFDTSIDNRLSAVTIDTLDTQWHFVTATYDGSESVSGLKLYIDGIERTTSVTEDPGYVAMENTIESFKIAAAIWANGTWQFFHGIIDEVLIYNRALSDTEIQQLWEQGGGSVNYIRYDDFEDYYIGEPPKSERGWTTVNVGGENYIEARVDPLDSSNMVMLIHSGGSIPGCALMMYDFAPAGEYVIHYRIYTPQLSTECTIYEDLNEYSTNLVTIHRRTGQIRWGGANCDGEFYEFTPPIDPSTTTWIEEEIRVTQDELHLWHDNSTDALGGYCNTPVNGIDHWSIHPYPYTTQDFYIDDFWITEYGGGNQPPVASFTWTPQYPNPGQTITFDASASYDPDGSIVLYEWDWDNNGIYDESSTNPIVTHTWTQEGSYPVILRVTDNNDTTDIITKIVFIYTGNIPPVADFSWTPEFPHHDVTVTFDASASYDPDGNIVLYEWDWDNNGIYDESSSNPIVTHTWTQEGSYPVTLRVTDDNNSTGIMTKTVEVVVNQPPNVDITYPVEGQTVLGTITINGTACDSDGTIQLVQVKIDEGYWYDAIGTISWSYIWDTTMVINGSHTIYARCYDGEDYSSECSVSVIVENGDWEIDGLCPIDLNVIDAEGHFINKTNCNIPGAIYTEEDLDGDGDLDDKVFIPGALDGLYTIEVIPEPGSDPTDTFSLRTTYNGVTYYLTEDVMIKDIPPEGYGLSWPNKPTTPGGPSSGKAGETYTYTSSTTDPDGDQIYYMFNWGDGTDSGWIEIGEASHIWTVKGSYEIRVKAKDIYDFGSDWSDPLIVIITKSKNKAINTPFLNFLEEHPNLFTILQKIIQRLGLQC